MAITKLQHQKEGPSGDKAKHLKNAIYYICDPSKTSGDVFVYSNVGSTPKEVIESMLNTKEVFQKEEGRQGYHFIISLEDGLGDERTLFDLAQDFCEKYLGDDYDYIFAIHNNTDNLHAHIIFNSVSRTTGFKYHYSNGDWQRDIQPITDSLCRKYNLPELTFDKENKKGISYAEWSRKKNIGYTSRDLIKADIDQAISLSYSYEAFMQTMEQFGYSISRNGYSEKRHEAILSVVPPFEGRTRAVRTYSLGSGYTVPDILSRIKNKNHDIEEDNTFKRISTIVIARTSVFIPFTSFKDTKAYGSILRANTYYHSRNPFSVNQRQLRNDLLELDKTIEELEYIKSLSEQQQTESPAISIMNLPDRKTQLIDRRKELFTKRKAVNTVIDSYTDEERELSWEYYRLRSSISAAEKQNSDEWEILQDRLEELHTENNEHALTALYEMDDINHEIKNLSAEIKIIDRICKKEFGIPDQPPKKQQTNKKFPSGEKSNKPKAEAKHRTNKENEVKYNYDR